MATSCAFASWSTTKPLTVEEIGPSHDDRGFTGVGSSRENPGSGGLGGLRGARSDHRNQDTLAGHETTGPGRSSLFNPARGRLLRGRPFAFP